jgi:hypothetical protein
VQGERAREYWDLDEAAWLPLDADPRWSAAAEQLADELTVLEAGPVPSETSS